MVFLWFSYGFPMVFLWFSYGFPSAKWGSAPNNNLQDSTLIRGFPQDLENLLHVHRGVPEIGISKPPNR